MGIVIREITGDEFKPMIKQLHVGEVYAVSMRGRSGLLITYRSILNRDDNYVLRLWVAFDGETPIGVASLEEPHYYTKVLLNLFVKPEYRRRGIGEKLLHVAMREDAPFDVYHTDLSRNLYQRNGFALSGNAFRVRPHVPYPSAEYVTDDTYVSIPTEYQLP
jgi:GNAT superfamily N-acetyltransferase